MDDTAPNNVTVTKSEDAQALVVAAEQRTISGRILPWDEEGSTSAGGLRFTPKAIRIPTDTSRVKLLRDHSPTGTPVGVMTAWDPIRRKAAWEIKEDVPLWSGALATAGDVVFYGTLDGWFKAIDARSGKLLWRFKTKSGIVGQPVTYRGPDGRQYVARHDDARVRSGGRFPRG